MASPLIRSHNTIENRQRIFRSVFAKRFFITITVLLVAYGALVGAKILGYTTYGVSLPSLFSKKSSDADITLQDAQGPVAIIDSAGGAPQPTTSGGGQATSPTTSVAPSASSSPAPSTAAPKTSACGNTAIPEGACTAVLSLESRGGKNNPYVQVDTAQLPDGTTFAVDKNTWKQADANSGTIDATANYGSYVYNLNLTIAATNGTWKITNYTQR